MNEAETRAELIDPALKAAGWGVVEASRVRREVDRAWPHRRRGAARQAGNRRLRAHLSQHKLAVIEAKRRDLLDTEGVGQAKKYAAKLPGALRLFDQRRRHLPDRHGDRRGGTMFRNSPTPEDLWERVFAKQNAWRDRFAAVPFEERAELAGALLPAQRDRERARSDCRRRQRILLTLATGTGKTSSPSRSLEAVPEAMEPLGRADAPAAHPVSRRPQQPGRSGLQRLLGFRRGCVRRASSRTKFASKAACRRTAACSSRSSRPSCPAADANGKPAPNFGEYPTDFFDFIVIDECHRGGANDESNWRGILEYFAPAVQIGLTATPKRGTTPTPTPISASRFTSIR